MHVNPAIFTVPQLREQIAVLDPTIATSKLRKAELVALVEKLTSAPTMQFMPAEDREAIAKQEANLEELRKQAALEGEDMTGHWAEQGADVNLEDAQVFQGAMHEATTPQAIGDTLAVLANSTTGLAEALNTVGLAAQEAAHKLAAVAWAHQVAVVRSMGRTVRGKVVDTVLRTPGPDGMGRVCLVVEHQEQANDRGQYRIWEPAGVGGHPRRTLHALADVQFEALAS